MNESEIFNRIRFWYRLHVFSMVGFCGAILPAAVIFLVGDRPDSETADLSARIVFTGLKYGYYLSTVVLFGAVFVTHHYYRTFYEKLKHHFEEEEKQETWLGKMAHQGGYMRYRWMEKVAKKKGWV